MANSINHLLNAEVPESHIVITIKIPCDAVDKIELCPVARAILPGWICILPSPVLKIRAVRTTGIVKLFTVLLSEG